MAPHQVDPGASRVAATATPWWRDAVVYQVYPRSWADSNGDGVGDLEGLRRQLSYLVWLGVDAIWLSPIYRSPMADNGYDVSDYCDIDPVFGTLEQFDRLIHDSHELGLRVMLDWVPNHTSNQHPWFIESRSSRTNPKRDWYFWRDGVGGAPPNNWLAAFGGSAWTWDAATLQWYLHLFLPAQPDLNWANPSVQDAMLAVLRFWLDRGVDGFRADVIHLIGKDPRLLDQPAPLAHQDLVGVYQDPSTHAHLRRIRGVLDSYAGDRVMVGEVQLAPSLLAPYYGQNDELQLVFNFGLLRSGWDAALWATVISAAALSNNSAYEWPAWALSNHDTSRQRSRYGGSIARARAAAVVLLTLRGTPFLFAGEELGLLDAEVAPERRVDPAGRDPARAPIPWDSSASHGWGAEPWLPWPPEAPQRNVATSRADPASIVHLYRRLLATRRRSPALRRGNLEVIDVGSGILGYDRSASSATGRDVRRVLVNFGDAGATVHGDDGDWVLELSSSPDVDVQAWGGRLGPNEAVLLRPAAGQSGEDHE